MAQTQNQVKSVTPSSAQFEMVIANRRVLNLLFLITSNNESRTFLQNHTQALVSKALLLIFPLCIYIKKRHASFSNLDLDCSSIICV